MRENLTYQPEPYSCYQCLMFFVLCEIKSSSMGRKGSQMIHGVRGDLESVHTIRDMNRLEHENTVHCCRDSVRGRIEI